MLEPPTSSCSLPGRISIKAPEIAPRCALCVFESSCLAVFHLQVLRVGVVYLVETSCRLERGQIGDEMS